MKSYEFRIQTAQKEAERLEIKAGGISTYHKIIDESLSESVLRHKGITATQELASSANAKVVVIGGGRDGLPIILNTDPGPVASGSATSAGDMEQDVTDSSISIDDGSNTVNASIGGNTVSNP